MRSLALVYWQTGNPGPDYNGDERLGDNLYSDSTLALDAKTGKLKWYFQYTPHDVWDWDAVQPEVLIDADWQGQPRKLLLHANRNGFFYVLDRTNGKLLLAQPFVKKVTWAKEIDANGRPVLNPNHIPTIGRNHDVSGGGGRDELVFDFVQSGYGVVLFADAGEMQRLCEVGNKLGSGEGVFRRARRTTYRTTIRRRCCGRSIFTREKLRGSCRRRVARNRGAGRWRHRRG